MRQIIYYLTTTGFLLLGLPVSSVSQVESTNTNDKIKEEILNVFKQSIAAGEALDVEQIYASTNDSLQTGFIENGVYFNTFEELMVGFKARIQGIAHQKMTLETIKITVLSEDHALLTSHGNFVAKLVDGRQLNGAFAWSFVYSKVKGNWKVIHSHMSNPAS